MAGYLALLDKISLYYLSLAILSSLMTVIFGGLRYKLILSSLGYHIRASHAMLVQLVARFANFITPFRGGVLISKPLATKFFTKCQLQTGLFVTLFDQVYDLLWELMLLLILGLYLGGEFMTQSTAIKLGIVFFFVILAIVFYKHLMGCAFWMLRFLPSKLKKGLSRKDLENDARKIFRRFKNPAFLYSMISLTVLNALAAPLMVYFAALSLSIHLSYAHALTAFWISFVIGRLSGIPGGFGVRDVTLGAILAGYGLGFSEALELTILSRVVSLFFPLVIGAPSFFILAKRIIRNRANA